MLGIPPPPLLLLLLLLLCMPTQCAVMGWLTDCKDACPRLGGWLCATLPSPPKAQLLPRVFFFQVDNNKLPYTPSQANPAHILAGSCHLCTLFHECGLRDSQADGVVCSKLLRPAENG